MVICDLPKLAPSIRDLPRAKRKYQKINALALNAAGLAGSCDLFLFFCHDDLRGRVSHHVEGASKDAGKRLTVLQTRPA